MKFTKQELKEIERWADRQASVVAVQLAEILQQTSKFKETDKMSLDLVDRTAESYDLARTISTKAEKMQEEGK